MNQVIEFIDQAGFVWEKGGALMPALGLLAVYLYYLSFDLWLRLRAVIPSDLRAFPRERWGAFKGGGRVDRILRYCLADHRDQRETQRRFEQVRTGETSFLNRRLRFLFVLATSAPLIGLLGTVAGMLRTFDGLSMQHLAPETEPRFLLLNKDLNGRTNIPFLVKTNTTFGLFRTRGVPMGIMIQTGRLLNSLRC